MAIPMHENTALHLGTSNSGWGRAVLLALNSLGFDGRRIFLDCGLDPDAQGKSYVRNPVEKMQHVWRVVDTSVKDRTQAVERIVTYLNASSFHALGFALYASNSITDLFNRLCVFREVFSSSVNLFTDRTEHEFSFSVEDLRTVKSHITADVFILFLLKVCRELSGPDFAPTVVEVPWNRNDYPASFKGLLCAPLRYNRRYYTLRFKRSDVEKTLPGASAKLASYQDRLCREYLDSMDETIHLPARVKLKIKQVLTSDQAGIDRVAASLNMSIRTLQRKLRAEASSFSRLLDQARKELTMEYIRDPDVTATQLAYMLGFSDLASFSPRFKLWFGQTFTEYRRFNKETS